MNYNKLLYTLNFLSLSIFLHDLCPFSERWTQTVTNGDFFSVFKHLYVHITVRYGNTEKMTKNAK